MDTKNHENHGATGNLNPGLPRSSVKAASVQKNGKPKSSEYRPVQGTASNTKNKENVRGPSSAGPVQNSGHGPVTSGDSVQQKTKQKQASKVKQVLKPKDASSSKVEVTPGASQGAITSQEQKKEKKSKKVQPSKVTPTQPETVVLDSAPTAQVSSHPPTKDIPPAQSSAGGQRQIGSDNFKGRTDTASTISRICTEQGFQPTGEVVQRFAADFFETSGLFDLFTNHLESKLDKGCNLNAEETEAVLHNVRESQSRASVFVACTVSGAPGCGKSTLLRRLQTEGKLDSVIILGNPKLKGDFSDQRNCYTVKEILLLQLRISFKTLLIDEFTLLTSGEILALQRIVGAKYVALFGDPNQGKRTYSSSPEWLQFPVVYSSQESRRFGDETAKFCQTQGCRFKGNGKSDTVNKNKYEGTSTETDVNIAFSQKTIDDLLCCMIEAVLVEETQGCEYGSVTVFIRDCPEDIDGVADAHRRTVAFTRHKDRLELRCTQEIFLALVNGQLANQCEPAKTHLYERE